MPYISGWHVRLVVVLLLAFSSHDHDMKAGSGISGYGAIAGDAGMSSVQPHMEVIMLADHSCCVAPHTMTVIMSRAQLMPLAFPSPSPSCCWLSLQNRVVFELTSAVKTVSAGVDLWL